ncbi:unannotated protein [freshwater metagenome]|uniref:Unannotated protein n=1 Tax=freshwater metagenome TaxID=449393 RepID=A0A6J6LQN1_9ZZZZ
MGADVCGGFAISTEAVVEGAVGVVAHDGEVLYVVDGRSSRDDYLAI